jgi:hypothetical protein
VRRLLAVLREGSYEVPGVGPIYFQDADTLQDASDLYAILEETSTTGSPNLENDLVRSFVEKLQGGGSLSGEQLGKLLQLLQKHRDAVDERRANPNPDGQDLMDVPDPNTARILNTHL